MYEVQLQKVTKDHLSGMNLEESLGGGGGGRQKDGETERKLMVRVATINCVIHNM